VVSHPPSIQTRRWSFASAFHSLFIREEDPPSTWLAVGLVTLLAFILRVLIINFPIGYDEAYTFINFASKSFKFILADYSAPNNHIFHTILVGLAYRLLGAHTWIVRVPAFLASVLLVPATYVTARRFFDRHQALAASALIAISPSFISYSNNGRGYPLIALFTLLLANFAGILVSRQNRPTLVAYAITGALGFYTIPIFLYPMAGISLWVAVTYLTTDDSWRNRLTRLGIFLAACLASGILTLILYSPVIIFGTGWDSLVNNEIVKSNTWYEFVDSLHPRITRTWRSWMIWMDPAVEYLIAGGFLISVFFYRKVSNQRLPMQFLVVIAIAILLVLQRVAPLPRIWIFLEILYLLFSAAGLAWLAVTILGKFANPPVAGRILTAAILLMTVFVSTNHIVKPQSPVAIADRMDSPEQEAAKYIAEHITPQDTILAVAPTDIQTAYYLKVNGVPYDVFYQRKRPVHIQNALVVVRVNGRYNTPQSILEFYELTSDLDLASASLVYEYGLVQVYSIPAK
jgi:4-amino-4-deoxy-L-arabinose transferase-like glycosyltransferase